MKNLILFLGAAALGTGTPALAQHGNGHGKQGKAQASKSQGKVHSAKSQGKARSKASRKHIVTTRNGGRLYAFNARGSCPPGLTKRDNGCLPPGQAKKTHSVGQRYNRNFGNVWSYNQIPADLRSRYQFDQNDRYYYRNGYVYQVDQRTNLIQQVVSALLR